MPRLAVLGYPVGHSRSPAMHNAALKALGMDDEWSYEAIEVAPEEFDAKVQGLAVGDYVGVNVTIPHKAAALALADIKDEEAGWVGAANTLSFKDGEIYASNTDFLGFQSLLSDLVPIDGFMGRRALVLGAGGASRAAVGVLVGMEGEVDIWNRTRSRAEALAASVGDASPVTDVVQGRYDLIVNTTAVGLRGEDQFDQLPLFPDRFDARQIVIDMVYGDRPSQLLSAAEAAEATTVDGLEVLVRQGALSFEIWTGRKAPLDVMRAAARG